MKNNLLKFRMPIGRRNFKSSDPIYAESYDIEDVWKLGRQIKTFKIKICLMKEKSYFRKTEPRNLSKVYEVKKVYEYQK